MQSGQDFNVRSGLVFVVRVALTKHVRAGCDQHTEEQLLACISIIRISSGYTGSPKILAVVPRV